MSTESSTTRTELVELFVLVAFQGRAAAMGSFLEKLFGRFRQTRQRTVNARHLRMETLERRQLMVNDLATITGTVFTDLTDNGLTADDTRLNGVTVRLFRDGGNGTFDNGAGDDVVLPTTTTNASGVYQFNNLIAGTYFVRQDAVAGTVQRTTETTKTVVVTASDAAGTSGATSVDTFTTNQTVTANVVGTPVTSAVPAAEALGGQREMFANLTAGASIDLISNAATVSVLEFNTSATGAGTRIITYDGLAENDATVVDGTGLGGIDLTNGGLDLGFRFRVGADQNGGTLTVRAYSSATDFSSITMPIDNTGGAATAFVVGRFADFVVSGGAGAVFSNINALQVELNLAASDGQMDLIETVRRTTLTSNAANLNAMSVGNLVFRDNDNDGIRDVGEPGITGVTVQLFSDTNSNGAFDSATDTLVGTQTTDASGNYVFTGLLPGDYLAVVPASQFLAAAPLFGFMTSTGNNPAPDPDGDVDNDDNGAVVGTVVATAAITLVSGGEPTTDGDADTNTNLALDFGFVPQVDVAIVKTDSPDPVVAGSQLTYTLALSNNGPLTATNVVATDSLPAGTTFVSANSNLGTVAEAGGVVTTTIPSMTTSQTATITIIVLVSAAQTASISNTATVTSTEFDTNANNNSSSAATAVNTRTDLSIVKTDAPDPVATGSNLTYTLTVTNIGPSNATGVTVTDVLPAGVTFVSATASQGTATNAAGTITGALGNIASGGTATVTVTVSVGAGTVGPIDNTATVTGNETDPVAGNNTSSTTTAVTRQVDVSIAKADNPDPIIAGNQITYTMTVTNNGPSTATNVTVTDILPAGLTFVSANASQGTATNAAGTVTGALGSLAPSGTATVTIVATVGAGVTGNISNTATVTSTETDSNTANNSATQTTTLNQSIDLGITKVDTADPVIAGNNVTYTLTINNAGPSNATGVTVTDVLPTNLTFVSATPSQGTATNANGTITANLGNIANGGTATITVVATVAGTFSGNLTNTATVTATQTDSNTTNNTATQSTTVNKQVDLRITKVDNTDPLVAGASLTYTITVFNDGPSQATNVSVNDILPAGVTFTSATASQGTATNNNGTITGALGTINSGSSATITVVVATLPTLRTNLTNTATVTATETEINATNNTATATTTVNAAIDLAITKTDSTDPVAQGGSLTYTILVTNNGTSTANAVTVTDVLPAGLTFTSGTATGGGTVTNAAGTVTGNLGVLAPGASVTMTIVAAVSTTATGPLSNTATVTATETDTNTANNSATQTTAIAQRGSIAGVSYIDLNRNGVRDTGETGQAGVTVTLNGTDLTGATVNLTQTTNASGEYVFNNLLPGTYNVVQTQPAGFLDGSSNVGTGAGGTAGTNQIATINLTSGTNATAYNFGDVRGALSKRRFLASSTGNEL